MDCVLWQAVLWGQLKSPLSIAKETERSQREKRVIRPLLLLLIQTTTPSSTREPRCLHTNLNGCFIRVLLRVIKWELFHRQSHLLRKPLYFQFSNWIKSIVGLYMFGWKIKGLFNYACSLEKVTVMVRVCTLEEIPHIQWKSYFCAVGLWWHTFFERTGNLAETIGRN